VFLVATVLKPTASSSINDKKDFVIKNLSEKVIELSRQVKEQNEQYGKAFFPSRELSFHQDGSNELFPNLNLHLSPPSRDPQFTRRFNLLKPSHEERTKRKERKRKETRDRSLIIFRNKSENRNELLINYEINRQTHTQRERETW
jgi:hypothetical protein